MHYAFQSILDNSKREPNKIWVDQGTEFCNTCFKKWLKGNNIEIYSPHNEGKSVVAEGFIRTLKNKIYKHMTAVSKNVYFDVLNDIVDESKNIYHKAIKMEPIDVKSDSFAEYNEKSNEKDPKFKVGDHVRISKYRIFLLKDMLLIGVKEPPTYVISDINGEVFIKKNCKKANQQEFRIEKVIKKKGNKVYVKLKGYNNSFNSWIDKKDLIK